MQARAKALDKPTEWLYGTPLIARGVIQTDNGPREYIPETLASLVFSNPLGDIYQNDIVLSPSTGFRLLVVYVPQWGGFDYADARGYILCSTDLANAVADLRKGARRATRRKFTTDDALNELQVLTNITDNPAARSTLSTATGYGCPLNLDNWLPALSVISGQ